MRHLRSGSSAPAFEEGTMDPNNGTPVVRSAASFADALDLRSGIAAALTATPVDEVKLRRGVWTYVGAERRVGTAPGHVITALTELVETSEIFPPTVRQAVKRHVILWCVEAYFGHLPLPMQEGQ